MSTDSKLGKNLSGKKSVTQSQALALSHQYNKSLNKTQSTTQPGRMFPSIGLQIMDKQKIKFDPTNPFKLPENDEELLIAHENNKTNKGQMKVLNNKKHLAERGTAIRTIRAGVIKAINEIPPNVRKEDDLESLGDRGSSNLRSNTEEARKINIFDEDFIQKHKNDPYAVAKLDSFSEDGQSMDGLGAIEAFNSATIALNANSSQRAVVPVDDKPKILAHLKNNANKRETVKEYTSTLRKILMSQMAVALKNEETERLQEEFVNEEERLEEEIRMFDDCVAKFDDYMKSMKEHAEFAKKDTEEKTKERIEKSQDCNKLKELIYQKESEIKKIIEELKLYIGYRDFIETLAYKYAGKKPTKVFIARDIRKKANKNASDKRSSRSNQQQQQQQDFFFTQIHDSAQSTLNPPGNSLTPMALAAVAARKIVGRGIKKTLNEAALSKEGNASSQTLTTITQGVDDLSDSELLEEEIDTIPFDGVNEMLEIYRHMEEQCLFLAHNKQEMEQNLEKIKKEYELTREKMKRDYEKSKLSVEELDKAKNSLMHQRKTIKEKLNLTEEENDEKTLKINEDKIEILHKRLAEMYGKYGGRQGQTNPSDLEMLKFIESTVEDLLAKRGYLMNSSSAKLADIQKMESNLAKKRRVAKIQASKDKEEEEKRANREKNLAKIKNEDKSKKFRGHPEVFRSKPPEKKQKVVEKDNKNDEYEEYIKYFT